jgi:SAM-dependent methyltransferase
LLDIASGSGYGSQLLARYADKVYGVDIEERAIDYAVKHYSEKNIEFKVGSGTAIPLDDETIDTVVTFETLEHIENYQSFIEEIKRVLKKNGQLMLSTPNDREFPEGNHFHVHEFTYEELLGLLKKHFKYVDPYYQGTWIYTGVGSDKALFGENDSSIRVINTAPIQRDQALYFMMVCSDEPIKVKIPTLGVVSEHWSGKQIAKQNQEVQNYIKQTIKHFENILTAKDKQIAELNKKTGELQAVIDTRAARKSVRLRNYIKSKASLK